MESTPKDESAAIQAEDMKTPNVDSYQFIGSIFRLEQQIQFKELLKNSRESFPESPKSSLNYLKDSFTKRGKNDQSLHRRRSRVGGDIRNAGGTHDLELEF